MSACAASPIYTGELQTGPKGSPTLIREGASVALFSVLMRRVAVSNSQGHNWTGYHYKKDYTVLYDGLSRAVSQSLGLVVIPEDRILNLSIYLDGYFPLRAKFYLNPKRLPVIRSEKEEELMLRTSLRLKADYFVTAVLDHSVTKFLTRPLQTRSTLSFHLYEARSGLIYKTKLADSRPALPYDRSLSLRELINGYDPVVNKALNQSMQELLTKLQKRLATDLRRIQIRTETGSESGPSLKTTPHNSDS